MATGEASPDQRRPLRIFFIPLMSPGHILPTVDMALLFSRRGAAATIVTTPGNEPLVRPSIAADPSVSLLLLPFPASARPLLPRGQENLGSLSPSEMPSFFAAFVALRQPLDDLLRAHHPDCLVSDAMYPWTADTARALGIPRIVFYGPGIFLLCVHQSLLLHKPYDHSDSFPVAGLPDAVELTRSELSLAFSTPGMMEGQRESEEKSYGVVVNSFYELEPAYGELYRRDKRAWYVGPVSLATGEGPRRAPESGGGRWREWLDGKPAGSVIYVCFGTLVDFSKEQLDGIGEGLEKAGRPFLWAVRAEGAAVEERGQGVVVRGWAPQVEILAHPAVGGFVTHCGWNSVIEGVSAGVPMVTWPVQYDQFVNEKLVTGVLRVGVGVGRGRGAAELARAVEEVMGGGEAAEERRGRAREYRRLAREAVAEGGSSYEDVGRMIEELTERRRAAGAAGGRLG